MILGVVSAALVKLISFFNIPFTAIHAIYAMCYTNIYAPIVNLLGNLPYLNVLLCTILVLGVLVGTVLFMEGGSSDSGGGSGASGEGPSSSGSNGDKYPDKGDKGTSEKPKSTDGSKGEAHFEAKPRPVTPPAQAAGGSALAPAPVTPPAQVTEGVPSTLASDISIKAIYNKTPPSVSQRGFFLG